MAHTIRGRVQIMLLLAWALFVILVGFLSPAGNGDGSGRAALSLSSGPQEHEPGKATEGQ